MTEDNIYDCVIIGAGPGGLQAAIYLGRYNRKVLLLDRGGEIKQSAADSAVMKTLTQFDMTNGGFGTAPKFPSPGTVEFLINRYYFTQMESLGYVFRKMLESMAKGGFYDQIGGGFHRYSVDEAWIIPHFEKMAEDNAWHLRNYIDAYHISGNEDFKKVAEGIIAFVTTVLSDPSGGFYASQDADVTPEDEGGYFTWTDEDFRKLLSEEEYRVLSLHFLHEKGALHHDKTKRVLFISTEPEEVAKKLGMDVAMVKQIMEQGKRKLLQERNSRKSPFIDKTLYTSINGMMISAYLKAFRVLKDPLLREFALKSLKRIMDDHFRADELFHTGEIAAVLDDYMYIIEALVFAYELTGKQSYLKDADHLMELCISQFWDQENGGFFDTAGEVLGLRLKAIEDIPHPSANALGIILLLKLSFAAQKEKYRSYAETALKTFSVLTRDMVVHSGYYFCALDAYYFMLKLTLPSAPENIFSDTVASSARPYLSLFYGNDKEFVIPCTGEKCYEPALSPDELRNFLQTH